MSVTVKKAVTTLVAVMLLTLITVLIVMAIRPIPLPFLSSYIKNQLDNRFHAYYVDFDNAQTRWRPIEGTLEFHLSSTRALDYGENLLASVPKVLAEVSIKSIFTQPLIIQNIEIQNPRTSFIRTAGGALKFDMGNTDDGSSGRVLETILISLATNSTASSITEETLTNLRIVNSDLTLSDEITGSLIRIPKANITLMPDTEGIGCEYDFKVFARGEYLHISGNCLYMTASENFNLLVNLDEVRPALLTEISPQFSYLTPLEVRLSGIVELELDKLLNVNKAEFDLVSKKGTLELADYFGKNININALKLIGKALNDFSHVELDTVVVALENAKAEGSALFLTDDENLDFKLTAFLTGSSVTALLPQWFAYLDTEDLDCINNSPSSAYNRSSLALNGIYNIELHQINASGKISCLDQKLADNSMQEFMMDGKVNAPNLTTVQ
ncbi:MAG: hypothetical protein GKR92_01620 [Gammaproteobacteria bacterium]|nr:MAG: hypothetical protein GKR92_01620 [Gammaproteobacteria bacterium]